MASLKKPRYGELAARLEIFLKKTVRPGQRLVLGLSGGLDSCVLLHLLANQRAACGYELAALHVNHGISPHASEWQHFCAEVCASCQVPFTAEPVVVRRDSGLGIEAAARAARYAVFMAQPADRIVLAHHQDDQAETLLLQLLRGAGVKGLAGMIAQRVAVSTQHNTFTTSYLAEVGGGEESRGPTIILRPLLDIPRATLEAYAEAHDLRWIEDESNLDLAYDRNFLRHHIFPELEKRFPASRTTLARTAAHIAEAVELLDEVAQSDAARWIWEGRLEIEGLRVMSAPRAKNLLRYWLSGYLTELPSSRRLQDIYRQLLEARAEAMIEIVFAEGSVRRYRGKAWFNKTIPAAQPESFEWHGESTLQLPGGALNFKRAMGAGIAVNRLAGEPLHIRFRSGGERLRLHRQGPARSLKNLFQEAGIPAWQRATLPLIYWSDELIAVPGVGVAGDWLAERDEDGLLISWHRV